MTESPEEKELVARINELAHKAKSVGLTEEETIERKKLRSQFLANFRASFKSDIEMMQVFDKSGKEVTPKKVKDIQRKRGLRDD
ncbi:DUF896 domain-containing protein (plasmid) [Paucilactobacillus suebicus]|uniref:UPF0291 protein FD16_GL000253 n=1 Tax=Paucilactobacillus suebicus DSM 5007 = KCTC 3549 TaxID=1423807 RepID=A0A0R1W906_9LACO|nr:DUF896 domain-containing protein [Paucilactobacillus suebicus]KRM12041.1 hypothetical protein FD16_GL000253 [Paucilactobacillus suebicus DSM 5007 = KCTC 3549]